MKEEKMRVRGSIFIFILSVIILCSGTAFGATIYVPDQQRTIQAGIDSAQAGDTVIVRNGLYTGKGNVNLNFNGKAITVKSENGPNNCIIDCQKVSGIRGFVFNHQETIASQVSGFSIINGSSSSNYGSGIYLESSSPTITNCIITGNKGYYGGGICFYKSSATVVDCTITGNTATWGGGLYFYRSSGTMANCIITGNTASNKGGGIAFYYQSSSDTITNCTFNGNTAFKGGAVYSTSAGPLITNCIMRGDSPNEIDSDGAPTPAVMYSDIQGGYTGYANIDADPMFVDSSKGDYHLKAGSPCIDTGNNHASGIPATDKDGNPRIINDIVDMGAYEYGGSSESFTLSIAKSGSGAGTVTSTPSGIDCGTSCSKDFSAGTQVALKGAADAGSVLVGWSGGGCSGSGDCTIAMSQDITITAAFDLKTWSISGSIKDGAGSAIPAVTVKLTGSASKSTTTDNSGNYSFSRLANGVYTITPSNDQYTFSPSSITTNVNGADTTNQNFTGAPVADVFSISGTVKKGDSSALPGVTMTLSGSASGVSTTDASGQYSFTNLSNGSYTITPTLNGYTFTPPSKDVTVGNANVTGQDFTGTDSTLSFKASGRITTKKGEPFPNILITFTTEAGNAPAAVKTGANGRWSQTGFQKGSTYRIIPRLQGYAFTPALRSVSEARNNLDFEVSGFRVSGKVRTPGGSAIAKTMITFSRASGTGPVPSAVLTDGRGNWSQTDFEPGTLYRASPTKRKYNFDPIMIQFNGPTSHLNFEGTLKKN